MLLTLVREALAHLLPEGPGAAGPAAAELGSAAAPPGFTEFPNAAGGSG